jgi:putative ABC transport system permease protein
MKNALYTLRQWRKNPGFTAAVVLTLALGIGANSAIFTVFEAALLHSLPYREPDSIVGLWDYNPKHNPKPGAVAVIGVPRLLDVFEQNHTFDGLAYYFFLNSTLVQQGRLPERAKGFAVSGDFWRVMGVQPILGRTFDATGDTLNSADYTVLSYGLWERQFGGDRNIVGQPITLDAKASTVIGVMPREFNYPTGAEFWRTGHFPLRQLTNRDDSSRFMSAIGRLKPGVSVEAAQRDLNVVSRRLAERYAFSDVDWVFRIEPLRDTLVGSIRPALAMLMAGAALVLLIACANVANLLLSRAAFRQREVAIRKALGCGTGRLVQQFLTEGVLLCLVGGVLGLLTIYPLTSILVNELPKGLLDVTSIHINGTVVAFTFAVCTLTGIILGPIPILSARSGRIQTELKQSETRSVGRKATSMRGVMIAAEVGLSLVLLIAAGLLIQTLWKLQHLELGFRTERVLTFEISFPWGTNPDQIRHFYKEALDRVTALPGVQAAGSIQHLPLDLFSLTMPFWIEGQPRPAGGGNIVAETRTTAGNYFPAMGIPLLAGRLLTERDSEHNVPPVALIDKSVVDRFFPNQDPIGKRLLSDAGAVQIVGIVGGIRGGGGDLRADPKPTIYVPERGWPMDAFAVRTAGDPAQLAFSIRQVVQQLDPGKAVYNIQTMQRLASDALAQPRVNAFLLAAFAVLALVLASVGVYGVTSYVIAERTREIGLRVALGAQSKEVVNLFVGHAMRWSLAGAGVGLLAAVAFMRFMRSLLFEVAPYDVRIFASVSLALIIIVLLASYLSARRAARVDPLVALRYE